MDKCVDCDRQIKYDEKDFLFCNHCMSEKVPNLRCKDCHMHQYKNEHGIDVVVKKIENYDLIKQNGPIQKSYLLHRRGRDDDQELFIVMEQDHNMCALHINKDR